MKLKSFLFVGMLLVAMVANAQSLQEVVYLKNGSIIRGVIIEQVPNESLKIQTADGNVFAYQMDEVEKITKEEVKNSRNHSRRDDKYKKYGLNRGYRGFVDLGYTLGFNSSIERRLEVFTSHGYQFFPYLFVGVGAGMQYYHELEDVFGVPIYLHLRTSVPLRPFRPFIDLRIGYNVCDAHSVYFSPSVGCRYAINDVCGLNVSIGYSWQCVHDTPRHIDNGSGGISFKVGVDF